MRRRDLLLVVESLVLVALAFVFSGALRERVSEGPWLPIAFGSGFVTALIMLRSDWLFVALGVGITLGRMSLGMPLMDSSIVGAAAVLESAIVIAILRGARFDPRFRRPRDTLLLVGASLLGAVVRAAAENATALGFYGTEPSRKVFEFVMLSHTIGLMLGVSTVSILVHGDWRRRRLSSDRRLWESLAVGLLAVGITCYVYSRVDADVDSLRQVSLAAIPLLMWLGLRGEPGVGMLAAVLVVAAVEVGTALGRGPYAMLMGPRAIYVAQTFGGAVGIAALLLHTLEMSRRAAQEAVLDREARLQRVLDASNDGVWEWSANAGAIETNERVVLMLGRPSGSTRFSTEHSISQVHPDDRRRLAGALGEHRSGRTHGFEVEFRVLRADGSWHWILGRGRIAERGADGNPAVMSGTLTDIHERKSAEAEREALEERRLQSQKLESLGLLAGGVAHDFNNILTGVLGHADLAREELNVGSVARTHVDRVIDGARGAAELTRQMLAYAGHGRVESRLIDLSNLVAEMGHLLQVSISRRNRLRYQIAPALPPVEGDPAQLRQVVMNLILNAAEALVESGGTILLQISAGDRRSEDLRSAWVTEPPAAGHYVTLEVRDDGVGMNENTLERLFDPFFTTKFTGRGLGLAAVLGIVRAHRGSVQVESAPGRGTTFRVHFPAQLTAIAPVVAGAEAPRTMAGPVLVVDDEAPVRNLAAAMLRRLGAQPVIASSGVEAVQAIEAQSGGFRLAFVDSTMPGMDGRATMAALRSRQPGLAIVVMSGWREPRWEQAPDAFLPKPFDLASLAAAANTALLTRAEIRAEREAAASSTASGAPPRTIG